MMFRVLNEINGFAQVASVYLILSIVIGGILVSVAILALRRMHTADVGTRVWVRRISIGLMLLVSAVLLLPRPDITFGSSDASVGSFDGSDRVEMRSDAGESAETSSSSLSKSQTMLMLEFEKHEAPTGAATAGSIGLVDVVTTIWPVVLVGLWLSVAVALLMRVLVGAIKLRGIKRLAAPLGPDRLRLYERHLDARDRGRSFDILVSSAVESPVAAGFLRPAILLPVDLPAALTDRELTDILLHETAHLVRGDDWTRLSERILGALLWLNPALHWFIRQGELDRELACDEWVVARTSRPKDYARCLTRLIELTSARQPLLASGVSLNNKQIYSRLERILRKRGAHMLRTSRKLLLGIGAAVIVIACAVATVIPAVPIPTADVTLQEIAEYLGNRNDHANQPTDQNTNQVKDRRQSQTVNENRNHIYSGDFDQVIVTTTSGSRASGTSTGIGVGSAAAVRSGGTVVYNDNDNNNSYSFASGDGHGTMSYSRGRDKVRVRYEGRIEFNEDETGIKSLSRDGFIGIYERRGDTEREVEIRSDRDGEIEYTYWYNDRRTDFDDNAREWLSEIIPQILRNTGWNADERVRRLREQGGVEAVFDEIQEIQNEHAQRVYFEALFDSGELTREELTEALELASRTLESDFEQAELYIEIADLLKRHPDFPYEAYVRAVSKIDSDFEARRTLSAIDIRRIDDPRVHQVLLDVARGIGSDFELAELLIDMRPIRWENEQVRETFLDVLASVDSDFEMRRVLEAYVHDARDDEQVLIGMIELSGRISSDFELAEFLIDVEFPEQRSNAVVGVYIDALRGIGSDFELRRVMESLHSSSELSVAATVRLLGIMAREISSDFEKGQLLQEFADDAVRSEEIREAFLDVVATMSSEHEANQAYGLLYKAERRSQ